MPTGKCLASNTEVVEINMSDRSMNPVDVSKVVDAETGYGGITLSLPRTNHSRTGLERMLTFAVFTIFCYNIIEFVAVL